MGGGVNFLDNITGGVKKNFRPNDKKITGKRGKRLLDVKKYVHSNIECISKFVL